MYQATVLKDPLAQLQTHCKITPENGCSLSAGDARNLVRDKQIYLARSLGDNK